jgi:hypothetical protein
MKTVIIFLFMSTFLFACKKKTEDIPAPLEDYSHAGYLQKTGFNQKEEVVPQFYGKIESGINFETKVAGSISAFTFRSPTAMPNVKIILWDGTTAQPITSKSFTYIGSNVGLELTISVTPIPLQKNSRYCVSYATDKGLYSRSRTDNSAPTYPIEFNNLKILSHNVDLLSDVNLRQFPTLLKYNQYFGDVSFVFQ